VKKPLFLMNLFYKPAYSSARLEATGASIDNYEPFWKMVHNVEMRTSINLDPDVYSFASAYADAKGMTLSAAISELVRRAEQVQAPASDSPRLKMSPHGYLVIAGTGDALSSEMVKEASEDEFV
jgi:hypothetical protein